MVVLGGSRGRSTSGRLSRGCALLGVLALTLAFGSGAARADSVEETASEFAAATEGIVGLAEPTELVNVEISEAGDAATSIGGVTLDLPAHGQPAIAGETAVYSSDVSASAQIGVQAIEGGVRALINIDSPSAPERYPFAVRGDAASLQLQADGSVAVLAADGTELARIASPWARDAEGTPVPTHYEINGVELVQVVEHRGGNFAYGITADPSVNVHLWGFTVKFTRGETDYIANASLAAIVAYIGKKVKNPAVAAALAVAAYSLSKVADYASERGKCLKVTKYGWAPWPPPVPTAVSC